MRIWEKIYHVITAPHCISHCRPENKLFIFLLAGGFLEFQATHPSLCESKTTSTTDSSGYKCPPLTSMSQPCLPVSNVGPTKILPFLYLGSQHDALSQETCEVRSALFYTILFCILLLLSSFVIAHSVITQYSGIILGMGSANERSNY